jgi:hypothetical protein
MSRAARHAEEIGRNHASITWRTGELSFVAIVQWRPTAANQQVDAGFPLRSGAGLPEME